MKSSFSQAALDTRGFAFNSDMVMFDGSQREICDVASNKDLYETNDSNSLKVDARKKAAANSLYMKRLPSNQQKTSTAQGGQRLVSSSRLY